MRWSRDPKAPQAFGIRDIDTQEAKEKETHGLVRQAPGTTRNNHKRSGKTNK
jgi:hypothetical protein